MSGTRRGRHLRPIQATPRWREYSGAARRDRPVLTAAAAWALMPHPPSRDPRERCPSASAACSTSMPSPASDSAATPRSVVLDAEVLTEDEMRRIAREVAGQEVAFVLGSDAPDYDVEIRFFSPRREVTFIGHATVAAHYVRAIANGVPKGKVRQKSGSRHLRGRGDGTRPGAARVDPPGSRDLRARRARGTPRPGARRARHQLVEPAPELPDAGHEQGEFAPADRPAVAGHARFAAAEDGRSSST